MSVLYLLERFRLPILNEFMLLITQLGEETAFLAVALIVFWCVDKKKGYFIMSVGFIGTMANNVLKLICRVPRPWVLDKNFTILEQAREAAAGYSFPSGHSQTAVGTFGALALTAKKKWVKILSVIIAILVPFSRMYIGVHTPWDVMAGSFLSLLLIFLLRPVVLGNGERAMKWLIAGMLGLSIGFLAYVELFPFSEDMDAHNLASGVKNAYTMIGCLSGVAVVYLAEKKYVNFTTEAIWWAQVLKAVLGLGIVLLVKEGLRAPLEFIFAGHMAARGVRYFLVVLVAGLLWPMTFRRFSKFGEM